MDDISDKDNKSLAEHAKKQEGKIGVDKQIADIDKELEKNAKEQEKLKETINNNNSKIEKNKELLAQLERLGEVINLSQEKAAILSDKLAGMIEQGELDLESLDEFMQQYQYLGDLKEESKKQQIGVVGQAMIGFVSGLGDSLGDTLDLVLYLMRM